MERIMTISYAPGRDNACTPMIRLQGKWLLDYGFVCGDKVRVVVGSEQITIKAMLKGDKGENDNENATNAQTAMDGLGIGL